jgi:excisionase family DNA binding protein
MRAPQPPHPPSAAPDRERPHLALPVGEDFVEAVARRAAELAADLLAPQPWLDVRGAAEHLACPQSRVNALASAGRIPVHRDGSRLLFRREELDEWVRAGGAKRP